MSGSVSRRSNSFFRSLRERILPAKSTVRNPVFWAGRMPFLMSFPRKRVSEAGIWNWPKVFLRISKRRGEGFAPTS